MHQSLARESYSPLHTLHTAQLYIELELRTCCLHTQLSDLRTCRNIFLCLSLIGKSGATIKLRSTWRIKWFIDHISLDNHHSHQRTCIHLTNYDAIAWTEVVPYCNTIIAWIICKLWSDWKIRLCNPLNSGCRNCANEHSCFFKTGYWCTEIPH